MVRPNKGPEHVDAVPGDPEAKRRVRMILATMCEEISVLDACDELGIGPTQWANLRTRMLEGCVAALGPRSPGRPRHVTEIATEEIEGMRQRIAALERENTLLRAKSELSALPAIRGTLRSKSRQQGASARPTRARRGVP